jgi:DNA-binding transcriptional MocR family regulator
MAADKTGQVYAEALRANVELTPPEAPFVDRTAVSGLRVCLGAPLEFEVLKRGLHAVKAALETDHTANARGVV